MIAVLTSGDCTMHVDECDCEVQRFWLAQVLELNDVRKGSVKVWWWFAKKEFGYYDREYYQDENGKREPYVELVPVATGMYVIFVMSFRSFPNAYRYYMHITFDLCSVMQSSADISAQDQEKFLSAIDVCAGKEKRKCTACRRFVR